MEIHQPLKDSNKNSYRTTLNQQELVRTYNINEKTIEEYFQNKNQKTLHIYAVMAFITAGKGYISKNDYITAISRLCNKSAKTAGRWLELLKNHSLINTKKGIVIPKGRKKFEEKISTNNTYIRFTSQHLKSYAEFQNHVIRQIALLRQRRFKYAFNFLKKNDAASLYISERIEDDLGRVSSRSQVGCSISKIVEALGLSKPVISVALKGYTEKQKNCSKPIKGVIARMKYGNLITELSNRKNNRFGYKQSYEYNKENDTYRLCYALASKIIVEPFIINRRYRVK